MTDIWNTGSIITAEKTNRLCIKHISNDSDNITRSLGSVIFNSTENTFKIDKNNSFKELRQNDFVGTIKMFISRDSNSHIDNVSGIPNGWLLCNGQTVNVTEYQDLYNKIGNIYGGDNVTFDIPNLNDKYIRTASEDTQLGISNGNNTHILTIDEIPNHSHRIGVLDLRVYSISNNVHSKAAKRGTRNTHTSGQDIPHENRPSSLCVRFIIRYKV